MKKLSVILFLLIGLPSFVLSQTIDEKLKEIDAYANTVLETWKDKSGAGFSIAIVKDDKVVFTKGYGVKRIALDMNSLLRPNNNSPEEAYRQLFEAVKGKSTAAIMATMSRRSIEFAQMVSSRNNTPLDRVFENGFTATTFANALPELRDTRIKDNFASVEVFNAKESRWEDLPFVIEDGAWRFAMGELFAGTFVSPGKSKSRIEEESKPTPTPTPQIKNEKKGSKTSSAVIKVSPPTIGIGRSVGTSDNFADTPIRIESSPVDENTVFAIASNSKAFTTAALGILVDEKKLNWDDKVSKYLPDFQMYDPWVTSELTIRDLVTHRVGLDTFSGDLLWYETTYSPDEILKRTRFLKPVSSFRTRFGYQNLMFIAAGKVVEKASGKSWCGFVTERILTPLGMSRTTCSVNSLPDNAAWPHNESGGKLRVLHRGNVDGSYSAAALNSSAVDLSKWVRTQLNKGKFEGKTIFSEQQSWQMHQQWLAQQVGPNNAPGIQPRHFSGVGMGWFVYDYYGRKVINHSGGLDGMLSYTVLIPEENAGFVVLTNSESPTFAIMMNKIRDVLVGAPFRDYNAEAIKRVADGKQEDDEAKAKVDAARVPNTKPSLKLADYAGKYSDKMYGDVMIAEEKGKLVMRFLPSPNFVADLEHWHYDTFVIKWRPSVAYNFPRGFVTFKLDKNAFADQLIVDQPNNDFWFYELDLKRIHR
ncbi:MAG TPA: serine hydrolase [Pyrinomonadaceae bacterium]|nr:serine hydrolase [Pyrinomonadaceae bacterium]